jgi:enediyne biosynthesis protein E4
MKTQFIRGTVPVALLCCVVIRGLSHEGKGLEQQSLPPVAMADTSQPKVQFTDLAAKAGLTSRHVTGPLDSKEYILESTGSGLALIDYNKDSFLDIFLVNGTTLAGFPPGQEPTNHLYQNNGDGTFKDVTQKANLVRTGWGQGACAGDYDNDGNDDLVVTYYGQNVLYRNTGKGSFADVTEKAGLLLKATRWNTGCSFLDYDKDGNLDLFVANYINLDLKRSMSKSSENCVWKGIPVFCGPQGLPPGTNMLYRNRGDGTFVDVSEKSGITIPGNSYSFTPLVSDYDNDGWPDIYVASDSTANILYHNDRNGTFTDIGLLSGTAYNRDGKEQGGMGVSAADYDGDGFFDIVKTNFDGDTSTLYHNNGDGSFFDVTLPAGLGRNTHFVGWGTGFFDIDNDGWKDIFMVNGHIYPEVDRYRLERTYRQDRQIFWNSRKGKFLDISSQAGPAILDRRSSRGAALGDLDNDGSLEIVINNMNELPSLLKNLGEKENWILIKTAGKQSNRNGIGARVAVITGKHRQIDEVRSGGSYLSQSDLRLHFGLGPAVKVDRVEVLWPSGKKEFFKDLKAGQIAILEEGRGSEMTSDK